MPNASILPDIKQKILEADLSEMFSDGSKPGISKWMNEWMNEWMNDQTKEFVTSWFYYSKSLQITSYEPFSFKKLSSNSNTYSFFLQNDMLFSPPDASVSQLWLH